MDGLVRAYRETEAGLMLWSQRRCRQGPVSHGGHVMVRITVPQRVGELFQFSVILLLGVGFIA